MSEHGTGLRWCHECKAYMPTITRKGWFADGVWCIYGHYVGNEPRVAEPVNAVVADAAESATECLTLKNSWLQKPRRQSTWRHKNPPHLPPRRKS